MNPAPFLGIMALLTVAPSAFAAADGDRGEGARYVTPKARIGSYGALVREVERWSRRHEPRLSAQERADLADWLNRNFYRFEK